MKLTFNFTYSGIYQIRFKTNKELVIKNYMNKQEDGLK